VTLSQGETFGSADCFGKIVAAEVTRLSLIFRGCDGQ
jgi:hypothetical protein